MIYNKESVLDEILNKINKGEDLSISDLEVLRESLKYDKYYEEVMKEIEKNPIFKQYLRLKRNREEFHSFHEKVSSVCEHIYIKENNNYRCIKCGKVLGKENMSCEIDNYVLDMNNDEAWYYYKKACEMLNTNDRRLVYLMMTELKNEFVKTKKMK